MTNRRKFLATMPAAAAGVAVTGNTARAKPPEVQTMIDTRQRDAFPNAVVYSHLGEKLNFYDDLIQNKVVMVNFMSIKSEEEFPVTAFIAAVADNLGDKLGRDVFIHSVTTDPQNDTPKALLEFAKKFGVKDGWRFVTTSPEETVALQTRLYRRPPDHLGASTKRVDIVFYGNGSEGVWGTFPTAIEPSDAAGRMTWVMPRQRPTTVRRAGPRRIDTVNHTVSHNREI